MQCVSTQVLAVTECRAVAVLAQGSCSRLEGMQCLLVWQQADELGSLVA